MDIPNIPWRTISAKLETLGPGHHQAWLARQLNVGTNVVANWRSRGGAPLSRAAELAAALRCSTDELLSHKKSANTSTKAAEGNRTHSRQSSEGRLLALYRALSPESQAELERFALYLKSKEA